MKKNLLLVFALALFAPWALRAQDDCTQTVPYSENFESLTGTTYNATTNLVMPSCWNGYSSTTNVYIPRVVSGTGSYVYYHGAKGFAMTGGVANTYGKNKYVLLPPVNVPLNQLQISFWMCTEGNTATTGTLHVGYVTSDDTSTFVSLANYPSSSATEHSGNGLQGDGVGLEVELVLSGVPANATRLAFKWEHSNSSYHTCCIDDVMLDYPPTCPKVTRITAVPTNNSVSVLWHEADSAELWQVKVSDEDGTVAMQMSTDTTATLTGLAPNTDYTVSVRAICGIDDTSIWNSVDIRTKCDPISATPSYIYAFDDASTSGATGQINACWGRYVSGSTTAYPYPYNTKKRSGLYSLYFYSTSSIYSYAVLPAFTENINTLYLSFWALKTSAAYGHLAIGVMSNPDDISTFDTIATMQVSDLDTWEQFDVSFANYSGNGGYIAILAPKGAAATNYVCVDDVTVLPTPTCIRPMNVTAHHVGSTTATISWTPSVSSSLGYIVRYSTSDFNPETSTDYQEVLVTDTFAVLQNLSSTATAGTNYFVKVAASCGNDNSWWTGTTFKTRCANIASLPYNYGFENATGSTSSAVNIPCWVTHVEGTTSNYPSPSTSQKHSGSKSLYFYSTSSIYSWTVLPAFEQDLNDLYITFWAYKTSANYGHIMVGVMSDPDDISTFDTVGVYQVSANNTWEKFELTLYNYNGNGSYIAFLAPQGVTNYVYVDDINIKENPSCMAPQALTVGNRTAISATINWVSAGMPTGFNVYYGTQPINADSLSSLIPEYTSGTSLPLTGLNPATTYHVLVRTICGDTTSQGWITGSFITECLPVEDLPFVENFDSLATTSSATNFDCHEHLGGGYVCIQARATQGITGNSIRFTPNSSTLPNIFILPGFEESISNLYMTFVTVPESATSGSLDVGYITDVDDSTTFVVVNHYPESIFPRVGGTAQCVNFDATFADAPTDARIAFRHNVNATNMWWFLDEIKVMEMPSCMVPDSITFSDVTSTSADLIINGGSASGYVAFIQKMGTDQMDTIEIGGSSESLYDLEPGVTYGGYVYGVCGMDTTEIGRAFMFTTACDVLEMPVALNAEHYWEGTASAPKLACWDFHNYGYSSYNWRFNTGVANTHDSTRYSYYFAGGTSTTYENDDWMVTPQMDFTGYESLRLWVKTSSTTTTSTYHGRMALYATLPDSAASTDTAAFYRLHIEGDSVANNRVDFYGNTWQLLELVLPSDLVGVHRLAFVVDTQSYTFYMDDAEVYTRSQCPSVQNVTVYEYDNATAIINWADSNNNGNYVISYWTAATAEEPEVTYTFDTSVVLSGLEPNTIYFVTVQTDCGVDFSMANYPVSFRTLCNSITDAELPYIEDFEDYASGATNPISSCWYKDKVGTTTAYPYPYTTAATHGSRGLYFYGNSSGAYSYAVMPVFESSFSDLMVEFDLKRYSTTTSSYHSVMCVGVMSDVTDITTFDTLATYDLTELPASAVQRVALSLEGYTGTGRIAFLAPTVTGSSHYNHIYLDSVVVKSLPDCRWPRELTANAVTASSVSLSWLGSGDNYLVEASFTPDFTTVAANATTSTPTATITGLNDYTRYYFRVRNVCSEVDSSIWSEVIDATTMIDCGDGFDHVFDTITYGTTSSYSYIINGYSSYSYGTSWHIYTPADLAGMNILDTVNVIRGISVETGTVSGQPISFRVYMAQTSLDEFHSATATATTNPTDTLPFSSMQLVYDGSMTFRENNWNEIPLATPFTYDGNSNLVVAFIRDTPVTGTTNFKYGTTSAYTTAYRYKSSSSDYTYRAKSNANIIFNACNHVPTCIRPADVTVTNIGSDSLTLSWTGTADSYTIVLSTMPNNPDTTTTASAMVVSVTGTSVVFNGLEANTTYFYYLRSNCESEHSTWTIEGSVTTACAIQNVPLFENFEGYSSIFVSSTSPLATGTVPCWDYLPGAAGDYITFVNSGAYLYETGYSLKFYPSTATSRAILVMPVLSQPISGLELSFQTRPEGTSTSPGSFDVGYITNIADTSTFVVVDHYVTSEFDGVYQEKFVTFANAPADARIAFRHNTAATNYYWFIDEVDVHVAPSCARPAAVTVSDITANSAVVHIADSTNVMHYRLLVSDGTYVDTLDIQDTVHTLALQNSTEYTLSGRSLCSAGDMTSAISTSFATLCGEVSLPMTFDPQGYATGSTAELPTCWARFNNATGSYNYPFITTTAGVTGSKSLYFYFSTSNGYPTDEAFITPEIDTIESPNDAIEITFWARGTVAGRSMMVGMMSGDANMSTYTNIATVPLTTTYQQYTVLTTGHTGNGNRVVFRVMMDTTAIYSVYVDDVRIDRISACDRVTNLRASNATATTALLGWADSIGSTSWLIEYAVAGSRTTQTITATSNPFLLTGLAPATAYRFRVAPICASGDVAEFSYESYRFTTSQVPAVMPYSYDFEDATEWNNWQAASNNSTMWVRGTLAPDNATNVGHLSRDGGITYSWTPSTVTNAVVYRDIDFGPDTASYTVSYTGIEGGRTDGNYDGISVMLVDPTTYVECQSTYLQSPWGRIHYVYTHNDTVWTRSSVTFHGVSGVRRLAFIHFNATHSNTYIDIPSAIDSINVTLDPCVGPYNLVVNNVAEENALVSWTGDADADYAVYCRVDGASSSTNVYDTVHGTSCVLTGLQGNTTYVWGVKKICSREEELYSGWSDRSSFTTNLCAYSLVAATGDENNSSTTSYIVPVNNNYNYTLTETIIDSAEIGGPRTFTHLAYYYNYSTAMNKKDTVTIYIQPTNKTVFSSTTDIAALSANAVQVYHGSLNCSQGWNYFDLDTVYNYNGNGNLMVIVDDNSGKYNTSSYTFRTVATTGYKTIAYYHDLYNPNPVDPYNYSGTKNYYQYRPLMQLIACNSCEQPIIDSLVIGENEIGIAVSGTDDYYVAIVEGTNFDVATVGIAADTSLYTFTGLTENTLYTIGVRAACGLEWLVRTVTTLRHPCAIPTALVVTGETYDGATLGWTTEDVQNAWQINIVGGSMNDTVNVATNPCNITGLSNGMTYTVKVRAVCGDDYTSAWSNEVTFTTTTCSVPGTPTVTDITPYTATVSWSGTAASYEVDYGNSGHQQGHGTIVPVSGNSFTISGLTAATPYDVYVRAVCAEGVYSLWTEAADFATTDVNPEDIYYTVTLNVNDPSMGTVDGDGQYLQNSTVTLTAMPAVRHHFVNWTAADNTVVSTDNPYSFIVTGNVTYTANFEVDPVERYTITAVPNDPNMGTVTGGGEYDENTVVTLEATAFTGYHFVRWNTNETTSSIDVTVTANATYTAYFAENDTNVTYYTVTANANNANMGRVTGGGQYEAGTTATLRAIANEHFRFVNWSTGETTATISFTVTEDVTVTANFEAIPTYMLTVSVNDPVMGRVDGVPTAAVDAGTVVRLTAVANNGYRFVNWSTGETTASYRS